MALKNVQTSDRILQQIQVNFSDALQPIIDSQIVSGHILNNVPITAGIINKIPHGLNRNLIGWFVVRNNANSIFWDSQSINNTQSQNLWLNCSADATINIFVF